MIWQLQGAKVRLSGTVLALPLVAPVPASSTSDES